jgi:hypothetical protein
MSANKLLYQSQQFSVSNVAVSARIEELKLSKELEQNLNNDTVSKKSINQLREQTKQCYISQRLKR